MQYKDYWRSSQHIKDLDSFWKQEDPARREPAHLCVRELHEQRGTVLDVGCGTLQDYPFFVGEGWKYLGLDSSPEMIHKAHELYPDVTIFEADIVEARLANRLVDLVYCSSVICHLPLDFVDIAIENMARITKRDLIIYSPYIHDDQNPTTTEDDPNGYIRNRFNYLDLQFRVEKYAKIRSIHRIWDTCAILLEVPPE